MCCGGWEPWLRPDSKEKGWFILAVLQLGCMLESPGELQKVLVPRSQPQRLCVRGTLEVLRVPGDCNLQASLRSSALPGDARVGRSERHAPLGGAAHSARRFGRRGGSRPGAHLPRLLQAGHGACSRSGAGPQGRDAATGSPAASASWTLSRS